MNNDIVQLVSSYVRLRRRGKVYTGLCPFHSEKSPSFTVYDSNQSFYCFGCGATGDCTGFTAKLFSISQFEAAKKISNDFGLNLFNREIAVPVNKAMQAENDYRMWLKKAGDTLSDYLTRLAKWGKIYAPKSLLEQPHPLFVESLTKRDYIEYLSEVLTYGSDKEKRQLYASCRDDIMKIRERLDKLADVERPIKRKAI